MEISLRRWFGVAVLCGAAVVVWLQARGLALLIGAFTWSGPAAVPTRHAEATTTNRETKSTQPSFGADRVRATAPSRDLAPLDPLSWPDCRDVRLTIVTQFNDPWSSRVTLHEAGSEGARLRRVGDKVAGKKLAFIGQNPRSLLPSVWLEDGEHGCQAALFAEPALAATEPAQLKAPTPAIAGLRRLGDNEVEADRSLAERTLENPMDALGRVRIVPAQEDGHIVGIRLFGITPGSLLSTIGLKNGDRVDSINGYAIAKPEQALIAYARLRSASELKVSGRRASQPFEIQVHIR